MALNPLRIPELTDQCMLHLAESKADLEVCSPVSKSWAFAAQHRLFRAIHLDQKDMCCRLERTLHASPHLIQHIRRLRIVKNSCTARRGSGGSTTTATARACSQFRSVLPPHSSTVPTIEHPTRTLITRIQKGESIPRAQYRFDRQQG
jgi:hypothetical protein